MSNKKRTNMLLLLTAIVVGMGITIYAACSLDDDDFGASQSELESNADGVLDLRIEPDINDPLDLEAGEFVHIATFGFLNDDCYTCSIKYYIYSNSLFNNFTLRAANPLPSVFDDFREQVRLHRIVNDSIHLKLTFSAYKNVDNHLQSKTINHGMHVHKNQFN